MEWESGLHSVTDRNVAATLFARNATQTEKKKRAKTERLDVHCMQQQQ